MTCRGAPNFEEYVRGWIYKTNTEVVDVIYDLVKGGDSLSNAVALAIESLPARKTSHLRRLVELFEPYCEWMEEWEPKGWQIDDYGKGEAAAGIATKDWTDPLVERDSVVIELGVDIPGEDVVAAFNGVDSAKFSRILDHPSFVGGVYRLGRSL